MAPLHIAPTLEEIIQIKNSLSTIHCSLLINPSPLFLLTIPPLGGIVLAQGDSMQVPIVIIQTSSFARKKCEKGLAEAGFIWGVEKKSFLMYNM